MGSVIELHKDTKPENLQFGLSPSKISKNWRRIGNQIRGRVSALLAARHGKKILKSGTPERLRREILERCKYLEEQKRLYENPPEQYKEIIKELGRKEGLFRNRSSGQRYKPYNEPAINELLTIGNSIEEIEFIKSFLQVCGVKKTVLERILIPQIFNKDFNV